MEGQVLKKQHNIEYVAIGALVVLALVLGITRFKKGDAGDEVFSRSEFKKKLAEIEELEAKIPEKENHEIEYTLKDERFPFRSPFDEAEKAREDAGEAIVLPLIQCQGMVWKSSRPQAIIDNKIYDVGDNIKIEADILSFETIKIKAITKEGVHVVYKGKEFIVSPK